MKTIHLKTVEFHARVYLIFAMMLGVMAMVIFLAFEKKEEKELTQYESQGRTVVVPHPVFERITE